MAIGRPKKPNNMLIMILMGVLAVVSLVLSTGIIYALNDISGSAFQQAVNHPCQSDRQIICTPH